LFERENDHDRKADVYFPNTGSHDNMQPPLYFFSASL
jgi:hypothetical protein